MTSTSAPRALRMPFVMIISWGTKLVTLELDYYSIEPLLLGIDRNSVGTSHRYTSLANLESMPWVPKVVYLQAISYWSTSEH